MASTPTLRGEVPSSYARLLHEYLQQQGFDAAQLLGAATPDLGDRGLGRLPVQDWVRQLQAAAAALNDPLLGLKLGARITPAHFGVMGYVLLNCPHLGAALSRLEQYQRLLYDVNPFSNRVQGAELELQWGTAAGRPGALADECAVAALVQCARDVTEGAAAPVSVAFVNDPPKTLLPYQQFFGCPVQFAAPCTTVRYGLAALQLRLRAPDAQLLSVLEDQAQALLAALPQTSDFGQEVAQAIARALRHGEPTLDVVARALNVSARSLHRRLEGQGLNFRTLREQTRQRLAEDYLADPRLTLAEIAELLGYSEQSAFNRAFRRWTGLQPGAFRRGQRV